MPVPGEKIVTFDHPSGQEEGPDISGPFDVRTVLS